MREYAIDALIENHAENAAGKWRFSRILLAQCEGPLLRRLQRKYPHLLELLMREKTGID
jgi:hypothetical protein